MDVHTHLDALGDPDDHGEPVIEVAAHVAPAPDVHDHLWMADGDRIWDLGPAETDTDADGVADSLTASDPTA